VITDIYDDFDLWPSSQVTSSPWDEIDDFEFSRFAKIWPRFYQDVVAGRITDPRTLREKYALSYDSLDYLLTVVQVKRQARRRSGGAATK